MRNMNKIGFVGLGIMGRPMAAHLQKAGHKLFLHDLGAVPKELLDGGATNCASGREVASQAEIVILMVPDTPDVDQHCSGKTVSRRGSPPARS
jgi:2-hydroxy-3-oxopropionate reductase